MTEGLFSLEDLSGIRGKRRDEVHQRGRKLNLLMNTLRGRDLRQK